MRQLDFIKLRLIALIQTTNEGMTFEEIAWNRELAENSYFVPVSIREHRELRGLLDDLIAEATIAQVGIKYYIKTGVLCEE